MNQYKMNILLISASYPPSQGGVATHVANLSHSLAKRGCFVNVLTTSERPETPYPLGSLRIWKLAKEKVLNFSGRRVPFEEIISYVMKNWNLINADLIHAQDNDSAYVGWMLKVAYNKPLIITVHRAPIAWKKNKYRESPKDCFMEAIKLYKLADHLIVPSKISKEILQDQGFSPEKITVIPHGVNYKYLSSFTNIDHIEKEILPDKNTILILCPGRADEHKDPITFVKGAGLIKEANPRREIVFLLTGEISENYKELPLVAQAMGIEVGKEIFFKQYRYSEMPTLYRRAKVCVIPSLQESFGQAIIESFVFRTPVVVANTRALSEIVRHEENGLLFNVGSFEDLAYQVQKLLDNKHLTEKLVNNGLKDVIEYYNAQRMADQYLPFYVKILKDYIE